MKNKPSLKNEEIAQLLAYDHWPHLEKGFSWKRSANSFTHVCRMVKKLTTYGMQPEEAVEMIRNAYWCAYGDIQDMPKPPLRDSQQETPIRYFDEFGIVFSLHAADVSLEELKHDYEFYCNLYAKGNTIWWGNPGGGASGGPLHNFLNVVRGDNNYAFGPTRTQRGWPTEKLAKLNAVGVYKRKEPLVKVGRGKVVNKPRQVGKKWTTHSKTAAPA
jgi:hypothetical protein